MTLSRLLACAIPLALILELSSCGARSGRGPSVDARTATDRGIWPRAAFNGVRITYIANSGFIIEAGGRKILIDALPAKGVISSDLREKAEKAQPPFDRADLVLVTHTDMDHFDAGLVKKYLASNPRAVLASNSQVTALLGGFGDRVVTLAPEEGKSDSRDLGGCRLEAYSLPHNSILDTGFLVEVGGKRFFHTGDVDVPPLDLDAFAGYGLAKRGIDFAFIPHFYLDEAYLKVLPDSKRFVAEIVGSAKIVPIHYGAFTAEMNPERIRKSYPEALFFDHPLESWLMPEKLAFAKPCWLRLPDLPAAHWAGEAAWLGGKIHIVGGRGVKGKDSTVHYVYNPAANTWSVGANLALPRANLALASYGGKLYAFGGDAFKNSVEIYDPAQDAWTAGAPMMKGRQHVDCGIVDGKIYVIGGLEGWGKLSSRNEAYDPVSNTWEAKADMPTPRHGAAVETMDGKIYVFGGAGTEASIWADQSTVDVYDPQTDTWERRHDMPLPRLKAASAVIGGKIVLVGGFSGSDNANTLDSIDIYDPSRDAWHHVGEYPTELTFPDVVSDGERLYVMGGCDKEFHPYATMMRWDTGGLAP